MSSYVLTKFVRQVLKSKNVKLVCHRCGEPLRVGDVVVSRCQSKFLDAKLYHAECWREMFIDI